MLGSKVLRFMNILNTPMFRYLEATGECLLLNTLESSLILIFLIFLSEEYSNNLNLYGSRKCVFILSLAFALCLSPGDAIYLGTM